MTVLYGTLGLVALQRLIELAHAQNNSARLRRLGAVEADAGGYPLYVLLHAGWLTSLAAFVPATTVMFVLERILAKARATGAGWERALMSALGPGFTAGFLVLDNR